MELIAQQPVFLGESGFSSELSPSWGTLRGRFQEFLVDPVNDGRGVGRQRHRHLELGCSYPPLRNRNGLTKEAADRALHKIISHFNEDSPRGAAQLKAWVKAKNAHAEVRASLAEMGYKEAQSPKKALPPCAVDMEAASLFPKSWFRLLNEELMADLVVDAFMSTFVDAFLDGAVNLAEIKFAEEALLRENDETLRPGSTYGRQRARPARLPETASEPSLVDSPPRQFRPLVAPFRSLPILSPQKEPRFPREVTRSHSTSSLRSSGMGFTPSGTALTLARTSSGPSLSGAGVGGREGFTMAGLPKDSHEAWLAHSYHASSQNDSLAARIHQGAEGQRPHRRLQRPVQDSSSDQRKFCWPMARAHDPEAYEQTTRKQKSRVPRAHQKGKRGQQVEEEAEEEEEVKGKGLLFLGPDGKTRFPYSLVLHKAFLESQPTEMLKEKAKIVAPLRLTTERPIKLS